MNLATILIAIAPLQNPEPLTLDQALAIAAQNSFVVRSAQRDLDIADQNFREATGQLGPQLFVNGNYTKFNGSSGFSTSDEVKELQSTLTNIIDVTGIAKRGVSAARLLRESARKIYIAQTNAVKQSVRTSFYSVLQAKSLVKVQQDELTASQSRRDNAKLRYEAGALSQFDVLRLETEVKRSEQALVEAKGNYEIAKLRLNDALGKSADTHYEPVDVAESIQTTIGFNEAVTRSNTERPEISARDLAYRSFRQLRIAHEGASLPVFTVGASWTHDLEPIAGQDANSNSAFIQFSAPLYTSGITKARAAKAKAEEEKAKIALEQTKSQVALEIQSAVTLIATTHEAYQVALKGQELAKEALRLAQLRYDEGEGILLDVTTAQSEMTRADSAVVTSRYQYLTAIASLQNAVGSDNVFEPNNTEEIQK